MGYRSDGSLTDRAHVSDMSFAHGQTDMITVSYPTPSSVEGNKGITAQLSHLGRAATGF